MRSALLDECFSREEREFLFELVEPAIKEGEHTLMAHREDAGKSASIDEAMDHFEMEQRQKRRLKFLNTLYDSLEEGDGDHV